MRGADGGAAGGAVLGDHALHQSGSAGVHGRHRLVEQPHVGAAQQQAGERGAAQLTGGKGAARIEAGGAEAHARKRLVEFGRRRAQALQTQQPAHVLQRRKALAHAGLVADVGGSPERLHAAGVERAQAGEAAQQRALAAAVGPAHFQQIAGGGGKRDVREQASAIHRAAETFRDQQAGRACAGGHRARWSRRVY